MTKQKLAQARNWSKFRLTGIHIDTKGLTDNEREIVQAINNLRQMLFREWDKNSELLGLIPNSKKIKKVKPEDRTSDYICFDCGKPYTNKNSIVSVVTAHDGVCGLCEQSKSVTHYRHFNYLIKE